MKNKLNFGLIVVDLAYFDLDYFIDFIKSCYHLDKFLVPWYYDFYLDKTYYIHLIDGNQKVFYVIPFKLSTDLNKNLGLVVDCYNMLVKSINEFISKNPDYIDDIAIYISKNIVETVDQYVLIKDLEAYSKYFSKFAGDLLSQNVYFDEINIFNNDEVDLLEYDINGILKRLDFGCTIFDLNKDIYLNLVNDPNLKEDYVFNDITTFFTWIEYLYSNSILYDFNFNETYYIHLIDSYNKAFYVIPFKLGSLDVEYICNCFNKLKISAENYSKDQVFVYISKEQISWISHQDIINKYNAYKELQNKLINNLNL